MSRVPGSAVSASRRAARPLPLAVLLSGGGRTLANLLSRIAQGVLDARVVAVASDRPTAAGLAIATAAGVPARAFERAAFGSRVARDVEMLRWVKEQGAQAIALAGYLSLLDVAAAPQTPILNIHPALLPDYGGKGLYGERVHAAVLAAGREVSGATVHVVDARYDHGAIVAQVRVPILPQDDVHALADRVFAAECELYPAVLQWLASGELTIRDGRPWRGGAPWEPVILDPAA